jgi:flagellum-specific peptidoglycan hydrolase FlgJ
MKRPDLMRMGIIFLFALILAYFILKEFFKAMNLSLEDTKPFVYTGKNTKQTWYTWIVPLAKTIGAQYGIPWQAIAVQTALETGWGKSSLLTKHNNFGGIKFAGSGAPERANFRTREVFNGVETYINSDFASWKTPYDGLIGYANFFHRNKRYATALKYPNDPYKFIEEIKKAGYATAPNYVSILHGMINNDLKNYA